MLSCLLMPICERSESELHVSILWVVLIVACSCVLLLKPILMLRLHKACQAG